jgi:hypothetical protein
MSVVIGTGLTLSVSSSNVDRWQTVRLYLVPFCVSSFSSLVKNHGFILIAPPKPKEFLISLSCCLSFLVLVFAIKSLKKLISRT